MTTTQTPSVTVGTITTCSTCRTCGDSKPATDFYFHKATGKPRVNCKDCLNTKSRAYHKANPDKRRARYQRLKATQPQRLEQQLRNGNLRWRHGLSPDNYAEMLTAQGGRCAICEASPQGKNLHVDHDHATGQIRALLCSRCNVGLGNFGDNAATLERAARYLDEHAHRKTGPS